MENWRHFLEDAKYKFKIWIDHKNLEYFMKVQKLNCRQVHWALYLLRFDFTLKHVPGTKIVKTDVLSRWLDWKLEIERDNENQVFIKDCWLHNLYEVIIYRLEVDIVEKIKKTRGKDKEIVKVVKEMKKTGVTMLWEDEWQIKGNLVLKESKVYILRNKGLRTEIIQLHHNTLVAEHGRK